MEPTADAPFMRRALELARQGRGRTHPNPMVGAVLVRDGAVVAEGFHSACGAAHAEIEALRQAGDAARGATLHVTLEPCSHHGRTPPCTDAIIAAGVARVVFAVRDPNRVAGGGAERLRAAGIDVVEGVEAGAARELNAAFFRRHEGGPPFLTLKLALSLDGAIAAAPGTRTRLTGAEALRETHRLRAAHDAILIGSGTARIDDPFLTVRDFPTECAPVRVVLDSGAALDLDSRLVRTATDTPLLVLCAGDAPAERVRLLTDAGVRVVHVARGTGGLDLRAARSALKDAGLYAVLVEGGAELAGSLLQQDLIDRMHLFIAPLFLGSNAVPGFALPGFALPGAGLSGSGPSGPTPGWRCSRAERLGADAFITLDRAGTA